MTTLTLTTQQIATALLAHNASPEVTAVILDDLIAAGTPVASKAKVEEHSHEITVGRLVAYKAKGKMRIVKVVQILGATLFTQDKRGRKFAVPMGAVRVVCKTPVHAGCLTTYAVKGK